MPHSELYNPRLLITLKIGIMMTSSGIINVEINAIKRNVSPRKRYFASAKPAIELMMSSRIVEVIVTIALFMK